MDKENFTTEGLLGIFFQLHMTVHQVKTLKTVLTVMDTYSQHHECTNPAQFFYLNTHKPWQLAELNQGLIP